MRPPPRRRRRAPRPPRRRCARRAPAPARRWRGRRSRAAASASAAASSPRGRRAPRRSRRRPRSRRRGSSGAVRPGSISSWAAEPRSRASAKPSPTSTPFTAWMPISAAARRASSRSSRVAYEPSPGKTPRRADLDDAAERVPVGAGRVDRRLPALALAADLEHRAGDLDPELAQERLRDGAGGDVDGRVAGAGALERVADVVVAVLEDAGEVGVAGPGQRHRLRPLARRLALGRPRVHPPRPVLVIAVADDERERRSERPPVPEAGEHLDLVLLELLARAAAVALLAAVQVGVDRGAVERQPRRQAGQDRDERRPVRFAGGAESERHAARAYCRAHDVNRRGQPGPALERGGALARRARRGRRRARTRRRVPRRRATSRRPRRGRRGRSRSDPPAARTSSSSFTGVACTTSSASLRARRPLALAGEDLDGRAARLELRDPGGRSAAGADHRGASPADGLRARPCRCSSRARVRRGSRACSRTRRCPRPRRRAPTTARLCGVVTFAPGKPSATQPAHRVLEPLRRDAERTYAKSSASAAKAAFCIRGESEPTFGSRSSPTSSSCRRSRVSRSRSRTRRPWRRTPSRWP